MVAFRRMIRYSTYFRSPRIKGRDYTLPPLPYNTLPLRPRIPSVMSVYVSSLPRTFSQRWTTAPPSTGARSQNSGAQQFA